MDPSEFSIWDTFSKGEEVTNHLPNVTAASHTDDREGGAVF